jgi:protein TonB
VILKVQISEAGVVSRVEVLRGSEPFVAAALAAVRTWRFSPALRGATPVGYARMVRIPFRIRTG